LAVHVQQQDGERAVRRKRNSKLHAERPAGGSLTARPTHCRRVRERRRREKRWWASGDNKNELCNRGSLCENHEYRSSRPRGFQRRGKEGTGEGGEGRRRGGWSGEGTGSAKQDYGAGTTLLGKTFTGVMFELDRSPAVPLSSTVLLLASAATAAAALLIGAAGITVPRRAWLRRHWGASMAITGTTTVTFEFRVIHG